MLSSKILMYSKNLKLNTFKLLLTDVKQNGSTLAWHQEACRVKPNGKMRDRILSNLQTNIGYFPFAQLKAVRLDIFINFTSNPQTNIGSFPFAQLKAVRLDTCFFINCT